MKILYNPPMLDETKSLTPEEKNAEDGTPLFGSLIKDFDLEIRPDYAYLMDDNKAKLINEKYSFTKVYDDKNAFEKDFGKEKRVYNLGEQEWEEAEQVKAERIANLKNELKSLEETDEEETDEEVGDEPTPRKYKKSKK